MNVSQPCSATAVVSSTALLISIPDAKQYVLQLRGVFSVPIRHGDTICVLYLVDNVAPRGTSGMLGFPDHNLMVEISWLL